jgi:hypothetical protein
MQKSLEYGPAGDEAAAGHWGPALRRRLGLEKREGTVRVDAEDVENS